MVGALTSRKNPRGRIVTLSIPKYFSAQDRTSMDHRSRTTQARGFA